MQAQRVAIVGLGRVGGMFLQVLLDRRQHDSGIEVVAVSELQPTAGRAAAEAAGIAVVPLPRLIEMARESDIDIVFDLSGAQKVRQELRQGMAKSGNSRTVIAPESIARLLWSLMAAGELPAVHGELGYGT